MNGGGSGSGSQEGIGGTLNADAGDNGARVTALSRAACTAVHGPGEPIADARVLVYGYGPSDIEAGDIQYAAQCAAEEPYADVDADD